MGYSKEVSQKAWEIIDGRRERAIQQAAQRQEKIYLEIPEIKQLQQKMAGNAAQLTKSILQTPEQISVILEEIKTANMALQQQRSYLLKEKGYPSNYLEEQFFCPVCKDTGYVGVEKCECLKLLLRQEAFQTLSTKGDFGRCTFSNFKLDYYAQTPQEDGVIPRARMGDILSYTQHYASNFSKHSPSLLFLGRTGLGKTHLSLSIAGELTQRGFGVVYTSVQKLMDRLEACKFSYDDEKKTIYAENINSILSCDLLILDDLGTEFSNSFTAATLYNIINTRLGEGRPTLISTNLELGGLEQQYNQRIASRLGFGYKALRFYGEDIRFLQREQQYRK